MLKWQQIANFPEHSVSEFGHIYSERLQRNLKTRTNNQGVVMVGITQDNKQHMRSVARLVADAFVFPEQAAFNTVIHLNGDHEDCRAFNLRWRTRPFALHYHRMFADEPLRVGVHIPEIGERYKALREACTTHGWVEKMAFRAIESGDPIFPQGWILEPYRR